jgi:dTDP-4-amino-4,6-dideoxygalactose transaminase
VRRAHAARLLTRRKGGLTPIRIVPGAEPGYLRLPFTASASALSAAGSLAARRLGVIHGYPEALCDLTGFADRALNRAEPFPGARALARRLITLPVHSMLSEADLAALEAWIETAGA